VPFRIRRCNGPLRLPLIEIPENGLIAERLSPGEIREPDFYGLFRRINRNGARLLVACPKGKIKAGRCLVPLRVLRFWHDRKNLRRILRECRDGRLARRRLRMINTILKDIRQAGGSPLQGIFHSGRSLAIFIPLALALLVLAISSALVGGSDA
jgi:hypothetical protein